MSHDWFAPADIGPAQRALAPKLLAQRPRIRVSRYFICMAVFTAIVMGSIGWYSIRGLLEQREERRVEKVRQMDYWRAAFALPLERRMAAADPLLIDFVRLRSARAGWPSRPSSYAPDAQMWHDLDAAVAALPPEVKRAIADKLGGIALIRGGDFSAITYEIMDAQGKPAKGFIMINLANFETHNANEWLTWKENEPFQPGSRWSLRTLIEEPAENSRARALEFLLLHEIGHLLAIGTDINPPFPKRFEDPLPAVARYPFMGLSWRDSKDAEYESFAEEDFPLRRKLVYYHSAALNGNTMAPIYRNLQQTNYATLYGASNPWDDFAESFVTYVHTQMQHRPYAITIYHDDQPVMVYHACWEEKRCEDKRAYMERVLGIGTPGKGSGAGDLH
ncbi:MAG TPA: hypothetical protein VH105_00725 [Burkholderiales bacterium]|nr:hypothetical protein [Burkholderiales bacterium]